MPLITDLFYLPPIEFFVSILGHKEIIVDGTENYQKQTYRNRARILLTNKVEILSIPVFGGSKKKAYKEIKIDYGQKWKNVHLRGIQSAYGKAPFFEFFFPYLEEIYNKNLTFLFDHNFELLTVCLKLLQLETKVSIGFGHENISEYVDNRGTISTKEEFTERTIMSGYEYSQMFGVNFVSNLSVLDLLFCQGTESKEILIRSKKND